MVSGGEKMVVKARCYGPVSGPSRVHPANPPEVLRLIGEGADSKGYVCQGAIIEDQVGEGYIRRYLKLVYIGSFSSMPFKQSHRGYLGGLMLWCNQRCCLG